MTVITSEFLKKKAREISYALNRVSFYIKRDELRNRLERLSFEFLENVAVAGEDTSDKPALIKVFKNISAMDVLIRIAHSLYEIETVNSNILIRELDAFNSAIRQLAEENSAMENNSEFGNSSANSSRVNSENPFAKQELNLESIFSMPPAVIKETVNSASISVGAKKESVNSAIHNSEISNQSVVEEIKTSESKDFANIDNEKEIVERAYSKDAGGVVGDVSSLKSETAKDSVQACQAIIRKFQNGIGQQVRDESGNRTIRQNLISERIRQSGKANVRTLINQFPGVSERTLRYDLQRLCDQGVVEKIGSSGPGTSYAPKNPNP
ncbi:MAG: DeoR family transcriptional regulator [bacterium]|nr:DeoR family transcriptional regulator [bacterium]